MAEINITTQDAMAGNNPIKIIKFSGQLDETNVDAEAQKIYQLIDAMNPPNLVLDFSELAYMNSKSIGYVTDWYSRTAAKNGKIVIAQPQPNILDILKVVGIAQIVSIHASIQEAQQSFAIATTPTADATSSTPVQPATPAPTPTPTPISPAPAAPAPVTPIETPTPTPVAPAQPVTPAPNANPMPASPVTPTNPMPEAQTTENPTPQNPAQ